VTSYGLWQEYAVVPAEQTRAVVPGHPLVHNLGVLGLNGLTAYFGMTRIGEPRPGQTVVVSAAGGGVGLVAGQIARTAGARVLGITGSDDKNQRLEADYGFAGTVNHRSPTFTEDLRRACGESGADLFFDNVGGMVLDAMLPQMAHHGRIVCCGAAAQYDESDDGVIQQGPRGIPQHLINRSVRLEGFVIADFAPEWADALGRLGQWLWDGTIKPAVQEWRGLESAPEALMAVLAGDSFGQAVVRILPDPD
jgi:NADPH-dependent curcumin reductase CurA